MSDEKKVNKGTQDHKPGIATKPEAPDKQARVELAVPRGYAKDEPFVIIAVNGVNYKLPRGKTSMVPQFVADEYHRATRAQVIRDDRIEEMLEASNK